MPPLCYFHTATYVIAYRNFYDARLHSSLYSGSIDAHERSAGGNGGRSRRTRGNVTCSFHQRSSGERSRLARPSLLTDRSAQSHTNTRYRRDRSNTEFAVMFSHPLPERSLSARDVLRFGLRGHPVFRRSDQRVRQHKSADRQCRPRTASGDTHRDRAPAQHDHAYGRKHRLRADERGIV